MIVCFDLETTGTNPKIDKIIEISMIKFDEETFEIFDTFSSFVDPEIQIPSIISSITNIFDENVFWAPKIEELKQEIIDFIWNNILLWHNVDFDINFFIENWINIEKNLKLDTFSFANFLNFRNESLNLEMLCNHYWIEINWAHRAINDTKATRELFIKMLESFKNYSENKKNILKYIFDLSRDLNVKIMWRFLWLDNLWKYVFQDFEKIILEKKSFNKNFVVEIKNNKNNLDNIDILNLFNFDDSLEKRENQLKMAENVFNSLDKNEKIMVEAPTWIWKSFAYLIPSIVYARQKNEKVYISTNTKTLQDQLFDKDLAFLWEKLGLDFSYSKLKWKKNYLSFKAFFDYILLWDFDYKEIIFLSKISLWLLETKFWELDELNFFPWEFSFKSEITSDRFYSQKEENNYFEYEFLEKARKSIDYSDIVIINHSLLFSDINKESKVLTNVKNIVIDEAHNIEDSITEILKKKYTFRSFFETMTKIEKIFTAKNINKFELIQLRESLFSKLSLLEDFSESYISKKTLSSQFYKTILILDDFYEEFDFTHLSKKLNLEILSIIDLLKTKSEYNFSKEILYFEDILDVLLNILNKNNSNEKIKILSQNDLWVLTFEYTILNPWSYLKTNFWDNLDTCVLTSATLSINDSFDYIKNILNLEDFEFFKFKSDFDYKKQSTLFIPNDLWNIKNWVEGIWNFLKRFYEIVWWNTLTLFTSFASIKSTYIENHINLKKQWINLLAQSIWWSKTKILKQFLDNPNNTIILWTDSFWEWVNIPGWNLKYLVIYKLPFIVPTDPIYQARSKNFKDSFKEYSIPKAIIKLKQWFGRLIRSKNDKWIVILLDDRINSDWWEIFYSAFPANINRKVWSSESFLELLETKL